MNPTITPMPLISRPDQDAPASAAYHSGSTSDGQRSTSVIWSGATAIPHSSTCGGTDAWLYDNARVHARALPHARSHPLGLGCDHDAKLLT